MTHSMGTMVAYDVLRNCPECPPIETLFTLGSPLGIEEVQDELVAQGKKKVDFPAATLRRAIEGLEQAAPQLGADLEPDMIGALVSLVEEEVVGLHCGPLVFRL